MKRIAIIFHRFGPYHIARLKASSNFCKLTAIELSAEDLTYAWDKVQTEDGFTQITLFDEDIYKQKPHDIVTRMSSALEKCHPDVVIIPGWADCGALSALLWCLENNVPTVVMSESQSNDDDRKWWKELLKSKIISLYSSGLVGGRPHAEYLASFGVLLEKIFTGYDAVDNSYFTTRAEEARKNAVGIRNRLALPENFFLASSRFVEKKNILRLLQAYQGYLQQAGESAWKLVLLGDGPLKQIVLEQRSELGLNDYVAMPGFKQYDELPLYYGMAKAFIHASTVEQWGLVVNEAMACGLPVLVSNRCGCALDLVIEESNGFTFDPYDSEELTAFMVKMSSGKIDLEAMGQASLSIISNWTPTNFALNLLKAAEAACLTLKPKITFADKLLLKGLLHW